MTEDTMENKAFDGPFIRVTLRGKENSTPTLVDVSSLLYDLSIIYDISILTSPKYQPFDPNKINSLNFQTRNRQNQIRKEDRLYVEKLSLGSPIELTVLMPWIYTGFGVSFLAIRLINSVLNIPLKYQDKKATVRLKNIEADSKELENFRQWLELQNQFGTNKLIEKVKKRINENPIQLTEMEAEESDEGTNDENSGSEGI
jgi:hypothetical protein